MPKNGAKRRCRSNENWLDPDNDWPPNPGPATIARIAGFSVENCELARLLAFDFLAIMFSALVCAIEQMPNKTHTTTQSQVARPLAALAAGLVLLVGCTEEPPPRTVTEFVENPVLLEAVMVRCSQDRRATRYDPECINAREAVKRIEAKEEAARRVEFERQSVEKRRALRRTQEAAAAARRRAAEEQRRREEEEYLAQFGVPMPVEESEETVEMTGNTPMVVIPEPESGNDLADYGEALPASDGGNAPVVQQAPEPEPDVQAGDISSIREELQRRNDEGGSNN